MRPYQAVPIAAPYSKCPQIRLRAAANAIVKLDNDGIEGDIVECGVWQGGGVILARLLSPQRTVWLYDTFAGMANRCQFDVKRNGRMMQEGKSAVSLTELAANLEKTATMDMERLRIVIGKVEETLFDAESLPAKIAFLHLDTDWYHSTKAELEVLWPRLRRNGIMIVDDYGHWQGAKKAVDQYFHKMSRGTAYSKVWIDDSAVMMVKS